MKFKKTQRVSLNKQQLETIKEAAKSEKLSIAAYIRRCIYSDDRGLKPIESAGTETYCKFVMHEADHLFLRRRATELGMSLAAYCRTKILRGQMSPYPQKVGNDLMPLKACTDLEAYYEEWKRIRRFAFYGINEAKE